MKWSRRRGPPPAGPSGGAPTRVTWSETFEGSLAFGQTDFNQAMLPEHREPVTAAVSVAIRDLAAFLDGQSVGGIRSDAVPAEVTAGYIRCDPFGGDLTVRHGSFRAFVPAGRAEPHDALHLRMRYDLTLEGPAGRVYTLEGFKLLENDPGYDSWSDATTLFVRILHDGDVVAVGVLCISPLAFMRELATFRGTGVSRRRRLGAVAQYQRFFLTNMVRTYAGPAVSGSRPSFPRNAVEPPPAPSDASRAGTQFECLPGTSLARSIVGFDVPDLAFPLNLHRLRRVDASGRPVPPTLGPVLLVPGSGVRAQMFYGQPVGPSFAEFLLDCGYDVWVESWRASIDLPPNSYTLDHAALMDHPRAVRKILSVCDAERAGVAGAEDSAPDGGNGVQGGESGAVTLKAVVHCQGSISFMMAAVSGLIDDRVTHIVSSAVSLFIDVTQSTWVKQRLAMPLVAGTFEGLDAQWGIRPVTPTAGLFAAVAKRMERRCGNPTCQVANYMYGSGWDVLFRHVDDDGSPWVSDVVHEWSGREVGYTPLSLIRQVAESSRHGYVVPSASPPPGTPCAYLGGPPKTRAQITFVAGDHNNMFRWQGQHRARRFFDEAAGTGQADFVVLPGFGHLDTFWGRDAPKVSFGAIKAGLEWERGAAAPSETTGLPTVGGALPPRHGRILSRPGLRPGT
ncbi:MAG: hypothetical protein ACJ780_08410 [Solirubrobacteraceae bacterium]